MKRRFAIITAGALAVCLSVSAFAASPGREALDGLKENKETLQSIGEENRALRAECKAMKAQLREAGALTGGLCDDLKQINALLREERQALGESKGEVKTLRLTGRACRQNGEPDAALDAWEQASAVQEERMAAKREIQSLLTEKKALLESAQ